MDQPQIALEIRGLSKNFGSTVALKDVSLDFSAGLMHGVIGPEGAGKTTLLRLILGLLKRSSGEINYFNCGQPVSLETIRSGLAYLPQQQSLYADLSVSEHLDFFRALYHLPRLEYESKREELLKLTRLEKFSSRPAGKLSGGMYKKLGLMCALLRSPSALLLDEPTNGIDPLSRRELWEMLRHLSEQKVLIIVTTAYMNEAERCARVHLLEAGKFLGAGEPVELLRQEKVQSFDEFFIKRGP